MSKNQVRTMLRDKGFRIHSFKASEITAMAREWFEAHRSELIGKALGDLAFAQRKMEAGKPGLSRVHMSGSKVEAPR